MDFLWSKSTLDTQLGHPVVQAAQSAGVGAGVRYRARLLWERETGSGLGWDRVMPGSWVGSGWVGRLRESGTGPGRGSGETGNSRIWSGRAKDGWVWNGREWLGRVGLADQGSLGLGLGETGNGQGITRNIHHPATF